MLKKKCSLCGGPLEGGRCTLCGLDNSVYERETAALRAAAAASRQERSSSRQPDSRTVAAMPEQKSRTTVPKKPDPQHRTHIPDRQPTAKTYFQTDRQPTANAAYPRPGRQPAAGTARSRSGDDHGRIIAGKLARTIIIAVILVAVVSVGRSLFRDNFSSDSSDAFTWGDLDGWNVDFSDTDDMDTDDYTYDPYSYVTREIPAEGESYEVLLGTGIYRVGVHIPEGVYRAELVEGSGAAEIRDDANIIFHSVYFGTDEEYDEVTECEDIRLYNGAELEVGSSIILRLMTDNAQPLTEEPSADPLTGPVAVAEGTYTAGDGDIPEGIFDISAVSTADGGNGYASIILVYPNGTSSYLWADGEEMAVTAEGCTSAGVKNVVIPDGTEVTVEYGDTVFTPSEGYYNVDFAQYNGD